jgi:hypothetical protein
MIKFFRKIRQNLLSEGKTGKYLKYAIGEIILVVIGILIALSINNWNDQRNQKLAQTQQLKSIKSELILGQKNLDIILQRIDMHSNNIDSLIIMMRDSMPNSFKVSGELLGSTIMWRTTDVSINTLNSMIASRTLNQLTNEELRVKLANLPSIQTDLTEDEIMVRDWSENHMLPFLAKIGLVGEAYSNRYGFKDIISRRSTIADFADVTPTEEFIGMLTVRRVHFAYTQVQLPILKNYIEELVQLINKELKYK